MQKISLIKKFYIYKPQILKIMKKLKMLLVMLPILFLALFSSCTVGVDGGKEAVLIKKPWFFGHGGVYENPISSGREWVAPSTESVVFDVTPITITENFTDLITKGNNPINFAVYFKLQVISGRTPELYEKFRDKWYEQSLAPEYRAYVRDIASPYGMFELASDRIVLQEVKKNITTKAKHLIDSLKMPVKLLDVTIGAVVPSEEVLAETRKTAAEQQRKSTQDARKLAEDARGAAEKSKALADRQYKENMGMTNNEFLMLRDIEVRKEQVELIPALAIKGNVNLFIGGNSAPLSIPIK